MVFLPTRSKEFFVGREQERELFSQVLEGKDRRWLIQIPSAGGMGKTRLMERMREQAASFKDVLTTRQLVDFYHTVNRTPNGLLRNIVRLIGDEYFPSYTEAQQHYAGLLRDSSPGDATRRQEASRRIQETFQADYLDLLRADHRILMLFDTCEVMYGIEDWVVRQFVAMIDKAERDYHYEHPESLNEDYHPTTIVFAGRKRLESLEKRWPDSVLNIELAPFTTFEIQRFFEQGQLPADDKTIERLTKLSAGRPIYVSLSYDWLKNDIGTIDELLALDVPFGERLVSWVMRLRDNQSDAILAAALAWRRMQPDLLGTLLDVSDDEARQLISDLSHYSFVKYRQDGSFQLQDEFRELVISFVWPQEGEHTRRKLLEQTIQWYEQQIGDPRRLIGEILPEDEEQQSLLAEWIFYKCQIDPNQAYADSDRLFRTATHYMRLDLSDLLNQELLRFQDDLNRENRDDLEFRRGLIAARQERMKEARQVWETLIQLPDLDPKLRATCTTQLVEFVSRDHPDTALKYARQAEEAYLQLIELAEDEDEREALQTELGQLYNNWGLIYRIKGDWKDALNYYRRALNQPARDKNKARTYNNMGYVHYLMGNLSDASRLVGRALQLRRKLKIPYELGLGYNTMGMILEAENDYVNATDYYRRALANFQEAGSERGVALVYLNQGRLNRHMNRFQDSIDMLERACEILEAKDDRDYLITALNELGAVYRERQYPGDREKAEQVFRRSLELSKTFDNKHQVATNWEDLSMLYCGWAEATNQLGNQEDSQTFLRRAVDAADTARTISETEGFTHLASKVSVVLGRIATLQHDTNQAFDHYFDALQLAIQAQQEEQDSPQVVKRTFDRLVNNLRTSLLDLPTPEATIDQAQRLLERYQQLPTTERQGLSRVHDLLENTVNMYSEEV